jgi:tetratricopeptide (TPR) repeat protein
LRPRARLVVCLALVIFAALALAQTAGAAAESAASERFAAASRAFAEQDYRRALADFQAALDLGHEGPAVHYNLAVCYYRLGEYVRAEQAFRELAREFPEMRDLAEYNLGLALTRQGREAEARGAFEQARNGNDERVAALAAAMLERLTAAEVAPRAESWMRLIDLRAGYDDNVALIDAASVPAGRSTESP